VSERHVGGRVPTHAARGESKPSSTLPGRSSHDRTGVEQDDVYERWNVCGPMCSDHDRHEVYRRSRWMGSIEPSIGSFCGTRSDGRRGVVKRWYCALSSSSGSGSAYSDIASSGSPVIAFDCFLLRGRRTCSRTVIGGASACLDSGSMSRCDRELQLRSKALSRPQPGRSDSPLGPLAPRYLFDCRDRQFGRQLVCSCNGRT
jgi:hypothetical protein